MSSTLIATTSNRPARARLLACLAVCCALLVGALAHGSSAQAGTNAAWIETARVYVPDAVDPIYDGSYAQSPDLTLQTINPYWTSYAMIGLVSVNWGKGRAWKWARWYGDRMDPAGIVYQFTLTPTGSTPESYVQTPLYGAIPADVAETDSASAHAATFLVSLGALYAADSKKKKLARIEPALRGSVELLRNLQDPLDGLVWSLPPAAERPGDTRPRLKLMVTQAEAFAGLRSAAILAEVLGDPTLAQEARDAADAIKLGVATLWDPFAGGYALSKHENGAVVPMDWNNWYPDAVAQSWLVAAGNWLSPDDDLVDAARATQLMATFTAVWPEWADPAFVPSGARIAGTGSGALDYQPLIGAALAVTAPSRWAEGQAGLNAMNGHAVANGRAWPFTIGNAGQIMALLGDV